MISGDPEETAGADLDDCVSVIIPVYRVEDLLRRCVDSILAQSYQNLQVILVDDGSPDRCGEICDEYSNQDSRVTVLHQANGGLSAARNAGIDIARGKFITFVDSDDWLHLDMVEELIQLARTSGADITMCRYASTDAHGNVRDTSELWTRELTNVQALNELLGTDYINMVVSWGKLYRRELLDGVRFPEGRFHEDEFTTHRLLHRAKLVTMTGRSLYYYWKRDESITSFETPEKRRDGREAFRTRAAFLADAGLKSQSDATYRIALRMVSRDFRIARNLGNHALRRSIRTEARHLRREISAVSDSSSLKLLSALYSCTPTMFGVLSKAHLAKAALWPHTRGADS